MIAKEIGDKYIKADCYRNLGIVYLSVGDYEKATKHLENSFATTKEIGDKKEEASCYTNLGVVKSVSWRLCER